MEYGRMGEGGGNKRKKINRFKGHKRTRNGDKDYIR